MALKLRFLPMVLGALCALLTLAVPLSASHAQTTVQSSDIYTIEAVQVDVTAKSAAEARPAAMASGQQKAFAILMQRMLRPEDAARTGDVPPAVIASFVKGMAVANERSSSVRYLALMTISFNAAKVRDFLKGRAYPYSEMLAPPALVLPVLHRDGLKLLWEHENIWMRAWHGNALRNRLMPVVIPRGGAEDQALLSSLDASDPQSPGVRALATRYGTAEALPVEATLHPAQGGAGFVIAVTAQDLPSGAPAFAGNFAAAGEDQLPEALAGAALAVANHLDGWWKERTLLRLDEAGTVAVTVPLRQVSDWPEVMRRLGRVTLVQETTLKSLRAGEAVLDLRYAGALAQLKSILAVNGLVLTEDGDSLRLALQEMANQDMSGQDMNGAAP